MTTVHPRLPAPAANAISTLRSQLEDVLDHFADEVIVSVIDIGHPVFKAAAALAEAHWDAPTASSVHSARMTFAYALLASGNPEGVAHPLVQAIDAAAAAISAAAADEAARLAEMGRRVRSIVGAARDLTAAKRGGDAAVIRRARRRLAWALMLNMVEAL